MPERGALRVSQTFSLLKLETERRSCRGVGLADWIQGLEDVRSDAQMLSRHTPAA
jgi:hypothetical protein